MRNRAALAVAAALLAACGGPAPEKPAAKKAEPTARPKPPDEYRVKLATNKGGIVIRVRREWAPRGADHFFELVNEGFYNGVRFHRVLRGFIAQFGINGNPQTQQLWGTLRLPDDPVRQKNRKGTVTFAKLGANSRSTQVFINLRDNLSLDKDGFAPFGEVVEGMETAEKLSFMYGELAPRGSGPDAAKIELQGNAYLNRDFPRLDYIEKAEVVASR